MNNIPKCDSFEFADHSLTCVSVRCREDENSALSAMLRECFSRNFFSRDKSC
jgi:hypothetical protein